MYLCVIQRNFHFLINNEIGSERISVMFWKIAYEKLLLDGENLKYRGESSVMYLMYPEIVIPKIKEYLGNDVKIIIMLRNPVERYIQDFNMLKGIILKKMSQSLETLGIFQRNDIFLIQI